MTPQEVLDSAINSNMNENVAKALACEALAFSEICEERAYIIEPYLIAFFVDRIKGVMYAAKEQNNA